MRAEHQLLLCCVLWALSLTAEAELAKSAARRCDKACLAQVEGRAKAGQPIEKALPSGGRDKRTNDKESTKTAPSCAKGRDKYKEEDLNKIAIASFVQSKNVTGTMEKIKKYGPMDSRAVGQLVADQQKYSLAPFRNRILFVKSERKDYEYIMMLKYLKVIFPKSDWFVLIHDDTYLFKAALVDVLRKYDPKQNLFIGKRTCNGANVACRIGRIYGGDSPTVKLSTNEPSAKEQERRKDFAVYQKEFFSQQTLDAFQKNPFGGYLDVGPGAVASKKALYTIDFPKMEDYWNKSTLIMSQGSPSMKLACYFADSGARLVDEPGFNRHSDIHQKQGHGKICRYCPYHLGLKDSSRVKVCRIDPGVMKGRVSMHHLSSMKHMITADNKFYTKDTYECNAALQNTFHPSTVIPLYTATTESQDKAFIFRTQ